MSASTESTMDLSTVDAGGIAATVEPTDRLGLDIVTARRYEHPALDDGRPVVRLVPGMLGEAEDLAMEFLGFTRGDARPVGTGARRAMGFPAWALVHDPANGRHALAMVKDMEQLARLAKSKPGNARDGYDMLAAGLDRAAPHFLPTFWEQAGRAFLAAENVKMAGTCFARAREADRVHGLAIDEARLADVYLEFALAGALPAKALTQYAQDLAARLPAERAYRQLRTVAVQRVAGGLAPHAGMAEELARAGKAAGLAPLVAAQEVLSEVLGLPAVAKASWSFWKAYRKDLITAAQRDPSVRGKLLAIFPDPPGWRTDASEEWLELLEATGAVQGLLAPVSEVEPEAAPPLGAGGWLERFLARRRDSFVRKRCQPLIELVERMVPRLVAEGRRVLRPFGSQPWMAELDVLDVLIAGGIELEGPDVNRLDVQTWAIDQRGGHRDLVALAGYPAFAGAWRRGVDEACLALHRMAPKHRVVAELSKIEGIRLTLAARLAEAAVEASDVTLARLGELTTALKPLHSADGAAIAPDAAERLAQLSVAPALARTLRAGLGAEFVWPVYDEAVALLTDLPSIRHGAAWPELIVHHGSRAVVIDGDRIVLDHLLQLPPAVAGRAWNDLTVTYVDGQLLVSWLDYPAQRAYWSGRPQDVFEVARSFRPSTSDSPLPLPLSGGGVTTGGRPLHAGDRVVPARQGVITDGSTYWRLESTDNPPQMVFRWREFDPATGAAGRFSLPQFLKGDDELVAERCVLRLVPPVPDSPLGDRDGMVGLRTWAEPDGTLGAQGVDGRRVSLARPDAALVGAVLFPGDDRPRPLSVSGLPTQNVSVTVTIHEPDTGQPASAFHPGRAGPPVPWWHWMRPRDPAGSQALRAIDDESAAALLAWLTPENDRLADAIVAVEAELPAITDPFLRAQVGREVVRAVEQRNWLAAMGRFAGESPVARVVEGVGVPEQLLLTVVAGLSRDRQYAWGGMSPVDIAADITDVTQAVSTRDFNATVRASDQFRWISLLGAEAGLVLRLLGPGLLDNERAALTALLQAMAQSPLVGGRGHVRLVRLGTTQTVGPKRGIAIRTGERTAVVISTGPVMDGTETKHRHYAIEHSPDGTFGPIDGTHIIDDVRPSGWADRGQLGAVLRQLTTDGRPTWRPELVARLVERTGLPYAEAALLLAGLPGLATNEANYLPKAEREVLGLSVAQARAARDALVALPSGQLVAVLDAAMPADPAELWRTGPDVDRLAAAWTDHFGQRRALDEELLIEANRVLPGTDVAGVIRAIVDPTDGDLLTLGHLRPDHVVTVAVALAWLAYRLAVDDPIRTALPVALDRARAALRAPALTIDLPYFRTRVDVSAALVCRPTNGGFWSYHLMPAQLTGPDDPAIAMFPLYPQVTAVAALLTSDWSSLVSAAAPATAKDGSFPHDPRVSVPGVVDAARERLAVSAEAAAYYLMVLALPDPTDRQVKRWTGFSAAELKRLAAELVEAGLVVVGKRDRAGRSVFLPGGWSPLKAPNLPVERWKLAFFDVRDDGTPGLDLLVPSRPVASLFETAWHRVVDGDGPRQETL